MCLKGQKSSERRIATSVRTAESLSIFGCAHLSDKHLTLHSHHCITSLSYLLTIIHVCLEMPFPFQQQQHHYRRLGELTETKCSPLRDSHADSEMIHIFQCGCLLGASHWQPARPPVILYVTVLRLLFLTLQSADIAHEQVCWSQPSQHHVFARKNTK